MGGSGGGGSWNRLPRRLPLEDWARKTEFKTQQSAAGTEMSDALRDELQDINAHDYEAIDRHRGEIEAALADEFEVERAGLGGSQSRKTNVAGLSDVDLVVTLAPDERGIGSDEAIREFAKRLGDRFPSTEIDTGDMAVTIKFADGIEVQVLPAFRQGEGVKVSDGHGGWTTANPTRFARELTRLNQELSGNVVPVIKLAKTACDTAQVDVKSYHLENLALKAFEKYSGSTSLPAMLQHLFSRAKADCLAPIPDMTGQSRYVDEGLTDPERRALARHFRALEQRVRTAIAGGDADDLKGMFH